jgi:CHASE2 domain-containing sensor protein/tRNA A-37 threonylcarbamoyl transferase component Bud32
MGHRIFVILLTIVALMVSYLPVAAWVDNATYVWFSRLLPNTSISYEKTALIAIDEKSIATLGPWPWSRHLLSDLINQAEKKGARTIGISLPLHEVQPTPPLKSLRTVLKKRELPLLDELDGDSVLTKRIKKSGSVVLLQEASAHWSILKERLEIASSNIPKKVSSIAPLLYAPYSGHFKVKASLAKFQAASATSGVQLPSSSIRYDISHALILTQEEGGLIPTFPLALASHFLNVDPKELNVADGQGVKLGSMTLPTDVSSRFFPRIGNEQRSISIPIYSAIDLLNGEIAKKKLEGKVVLIGHSTEQYTPMLIGPANIPMLPMQWSALGLEAILQNKYVSTPFWSYGLERLLIVIFAGLLIFLPKKSQSMSGIWISAVLAFITLNVSLLSLLTQSLWLPLGFVAVYLIVAHLLISIRSAIAFAYTDIQNQLDGAYRELAQNHQSQGQLDRAFEYLCKSEAGRAQYEQLYELGLDFERRRQFSKAATVYDFIAARSAKFRDIKSRLSQLRSMPQTVSKGSTNPSSCTATIVIDEKSQVRPVIGRYQIEHEIGRGAMATVYLGKDPKIGRTVAIKTMALTEEFDSGQLDEARRRFHQEAKTAGQLNHPNIVTIYDAGEEHDLAYIAMDYINGSTLDCFKRPDTLLPIREVLDIGIKIAAALEYAHSKKVVHRDIKPANIIYDQETGVLKVTDFGIAYLTDNSKTRSGTVMGSPYYMSPEQLAGRRVDGRADIYSLGVTLYELFTGQLPFDGESMANLIYSITNDKQKSIRKIRPELPTCLVKIINKTLAKEAKARYENAGKLKDVLISCQSKLS